MQTLRVFSLDYVNPQTDPLSLLNIPSTDTSRALYVNMLRASPVIYVDMILLKT